MAGSILIWLLCAVGFAVLYVFSPSVLTLALVGAAVVLPVLAIAAALALRKKVTAELILPDSILKNEPSTLTFAAENHAVLPFLRVSAEFSAENRLTGETAVQQLNCVLAAKSRSRTEISFCAVHCGEMCFRMQKLTVYDLFGLVPMHVPCVQEKRLLILPETFEPKICLPLRSGETEDSDTYSQEKPGFDYAEVFQVRDYHEGDSPKQIHWKLTTKFDALMVRDPGLPLERSVLVFWERGCEEERTEQTDAMAEILVSVVRALLQQGVRCTLAWNGRSGDLELNTLRQEEELYDLLPKLLQAKACAQDGLDMYLRLYGAQKSGKVIFLSAKTTPLLEALCPQELLTVLLCADEPEETYGRLYCFGAENYAEALCEIDLY